MASLPTRIRVEAMALLCSPAARVMQTRVVVPLVSRPRGDGQRRREACFRHESSFAAGTWIPRLHYGGGVRGGAYAFHSSRDSPLGRVRSSSCPSGAYVTYRLSPV